MGNWRHKIDGIVKEAIVKQLELSGQLDDIEDKFQYIKDNQKIDGIDWYTYYTLTEEQFKVFEEWFIKLLMKKYRVPVTSRERLFGEFVLMWGLKNK